MRKHGEVPLSRHALERLQGKQGDKIEAISDANIPGFRHFLGSLEPKERLFGALLTTEEERIKARKLMSKLATRMAVAFPWSESKGKAESWENPKIPSGYTYLLQLVAHDLVHTSVPISIIDDTSGGTRNDRFGRLRLDTIYGGGPDICPLRLCARRDAPPCPHPTAAGPHGAGRADPRRVPVPRHRQDRAAECCRPGLRGIDRRADCRPAQRRSRDHVAAHDRLPSLAQRDR
jgi:hypothetical protein